MTMSFLAVLAAAIACPRVCERKHAPVPSETEAEKQICDINTANSSVKSISCIISAIATRTEVSYIKPSKFIAKTSSLGRKQAEVATDGDDYWFWIREFDRDSVYHCPLPKISSTRVTFPMRPKLMTSVLCVDQLSYDSISIDAGGAIHLKSKEDELFKHVTVMNGKISEIAYSMGNIPILDISIKSHQKINGIELPKNVHIFWHEQNAHTNAEIKNVVINIKDKLEIKMPEGMKRISLIDF